MTNTATIPDPITTPKTSAGRVLLPYQEAWRTDYERDASGKALKGRDGQPVPRAMKIWEKSRRVGATFVEANDAVFSRLVGRSCDYWFSSADESAAYEFAEYCRYWMKVANKVVEVATEQVYDEVTKRAATAYVVRMPNGSRITAMSSNPRRFRSKGGDVCLDEFAFHDDPMGMYDAASPTATHGFSIRILSTHNGEGTAFHKFVQEGKRHLDGTAQKGDMPWSMHRVTIVEAVEQGLVERVVQPNRPDMTRDRFLADQRARCRNEDQWLQEYMAVPSKDASSWLTYQLIEACEADTPEAPTYTEGQRYIGMDIGESKDRTVIWTVERVGDVLWTREVLVMTDEDLSVKQAALLERMKHPKVVRACIDATGLGTQIAQEAVKTGKGEAVKFTLPAKDELASPLRGYFEDRTVRVPGDSDTREQLHAVRMTRTANGTPRFDAARTEDGHADKFWALALACHAAKNTFTGCGAIQL